MEPILQASLDFLRYNSDFLLGAATVSLGYVVGFYAGERYGFQKALAMAIIEGGTLVVEHKKNKSNLVEKKEA